MILKNKFLNKILRNKKSKFLRNLANIKATHLLLDHTIKNQSVSDGFFWRVDNNYKTIIRFLDILNFFYKEPSTEIKLIFFDKNFNLIMEYNLPSIKDHNSVIIDQKFLNIDSGYGSFYIFHSSDKDLGVIIRNSCYTGYSFKGSIPSFVHGNLHAAVKNFKSKKISYGLGAKLFMRQNLYKVQNYMSFDKTEIVLMNNCNSKIKIDLGFKKLHLKKGCLTIENIENMKIVNIKSNSFLLRPIIFNYNNNYFDVYHG